MRANRITIECYLCLTVCLPFILFNFFFNLTFDFYAGHKNFFGNLPHFLFFSGLDAKCDFEGKHFVWQSFEQSNLRASHRRMRTQIGYRNSTGW
jgi:hypothetical protein